MYVWWQKAKGKRETDRLKVQQQQNQEGSHSYNHGWWNESLSVCVCLSLSLVQVCTVEADVFCLPQLLLSDRPPRKLLRLLRFEGGRSEDRPPDDGRSLLFRSSLPPLCPPREGCLPPPLCGGRRGLLLVRPCTELRRLQGRVLGVEPGVEMRMIVFPFCHSGPNRKSSALDASTRNFWERPCQLTGEACHSASGAS